MLNEHFLSTNLGTNEFRLMSSLMLNELLLSLPLKDSASVLRMYISLLSKWHLSNYSNSAPKAQPKSAVPTKNNAAGAGARGKGGRGAKKGARNPRPAKKTAEELDSEMADYWETGATNGGDAATTSGTAQPANGDANMDEEILVSHNIHLTLWNFR